MQTFGRFEMVEMKDSYLAGYAAIYGVIIGIIASVFSPRLLTVLPVLWITTIGIRVCAVAIPQPMNGRVRGGFRSLHALIIPVLGVWQIASYTNPPAPWLALLGSGLSDLGYTLGAGALFVGHFDILALCNRRATICAAIASFLVGTVLLNIPHW